MNTVKIVIDGEVKPEEKVFDNVTKIKGLLALDMFDNYIEIYQGSKVTKINQWEIIDFTIE